MSRDALLRMIFVYLNQRFLASPLKRGSIRAVRAYVRAVKAARLALLGIFAFSSLTAALVAGIVLTVVGLLGLTPLSATATAVTVFLLGISLLSAAGVVLLRLFNQARWLEVSRSYELITAVTDMSMDPETRTDARGPAMIPPDPIMPLVP